MDIVKDIKAFLGTKGLNWNGEIMAGRDKDFRPATEKDFNELDNYDFLISFGKDGEIAVSIEVDLIHFRINGESFEASCNCYAGDKEENKKLCEERDLSKEWVMFELKSNGLIYAAALKLQCAREKEKTETQSEQRVKQLDRKIAYLERSKEKVEENKNIRLNEIASIEKLVQEVENS